MLEPVVTSAAPGPDVDPFGGGSDLAALQSETLRLETEANAAPAPVPSAKVEPVVTPKAQDPKGDKQPDPLSKKDKPIVPAEGDKPGGKEKGGAPAPDPVTDPDESGNPTELKQDVKATELLNRALEKANRLSSEIGRQANRAGTAEKRLRELESTQTEQSRAIEDILIKNPVAAKRLKDPVFVEKLNALLFGDDDPAAAPANNAVADTENVFSDDDLSILEEVEETKGLVKGIRKLQEITQNLTKGYKEQQVVIDEFRQNLDGRAASDTVRATEKNTENMYSVLTELHGSFPEMDLGEYTPESLNLAFLDGKLDENSPRGKELISRAKMGNKIYNFFIQGPNGTGTPEKPHYLSIRTARRELMELSGEADADDAKRRMADRRKTLDAANLTKKPSVNKLSGSDTQPNDRSKDPQGPDEARQMMADLDARLEKDGRELTASEYSLYKKWQRMAEGGE